MEQNLALVNDEVLIGSELMMTVNASDFSLTTRYNLSLVFMIQKNNYEVNME